MKRRIFYNGIILTMNKAEPTAEYVLTEGDKVAAVGSAAHCRRCRACELTGAVDVAGIHRFAYPYADSGIEPAQIGHKRHGI